LIKSNIVLLRAIEFAGGIVTALLGIFIYVHIALKETAVQTVDEPSPRSVVMVFLMLVCPGMSMGLGSYIQVVLRKQWGAVIVFAGGVANLFFLILNGGLLFTLTQEVWSLRAIVADLGVVLLTLATALMNTSVPSDSS
jgi:hypothetical protein